MNILLLVGGLLGLSSVMMAAYVDHSLGLYLNGKALNSLLTAVKYHQLYAIIISMMGLYLPMQINPPFKSWLNRSAYLFIVGILLFSFSIYCSILFSFPRIIYGTPIGGILLMVGWVCLIRASLLKIK